jgi:hypothetical protein
MRTHKIVALAGGALLFSGAGCGSEDGFVSMGADTLSTGGTSTGGKASSTGGKASSTGGSPSSGGMASGGTAGSPGQDPGPTGIPITLCPEELPLDDISVMRSEIEGDRLTVTVQYGGGCEQHDVALCYEPAFGESDPPSVITHFLHDANGDTCEALISETLVFDLSPLSAHGEPLLHTEFGMYASGELSCPERFSLYASRVNERSRQDLSCSEDADCVAVSTLTACSSGCGAVVNATVQDGWEETLSRIDEEVCRPFTEAGCRSPATACAELLPVCVEGQCRSQPSKP